MTTVELYGLSNCDTVKKARIWLEAEGIAYSFHDFRKEGAEPDRLRAWLSEKDRDVLVNRRGTTWRNLPDAEKDGLDDDRAVALMAANPSLIKRPVVEHDGGLLVGFVEAEWRAALA